MGNLGLDHWNGGRQLEVDHQLDSTIQLVEQGCVFGRQYLAKERNIFLSQLPNRLIDADPLANRRFSLWIRRRDLAVMATFPSWSMSEIADQAS